MAKCAVTGKGTVFGNRVSHSHRRSNRMFHANLQRVHVEINGTRKHIWVSARALRSGCVNRVCKGGKQQ